MEIDVRGTVTALQACRLFGGSVAKGMKKISYNGYRFPPEIIQQTIWLYLRFTLSFNRGWRAIGRQCRDPGGVVR
jgi:hypothetical protein